MKEEEIKNKMKEVEESYKKLDEQIKKLRENKLRLEGQYGLLKSMLGENVQENVQKVEAEEIGD